MTLPEDLLKFPVPKMLYVVLLPRWWPGQMQNFQLLEQLLVFFVTLREFLWPGIFILITRILFVLYIISSLHGHKKSLLFRRVPRAVSGYMLLTGLPIGKRSKVTTSGCLKVSDANGTGMIPMKQHFQIYLSQHLWKM